MLFTKKSKILFILTILIIGLVACNEVLNDENRDKIIAEYMDFQKEMGKIDNDECLVSVPDIFTDDVVKITDGQKIAKGLKNLEQHCMELRSKYKSWYIGVKSEIISSDNNSATIRYQITTDEVGIFEVVAFLKFSKDHRIKEINEFYYRIEILRAED